MRSILLLALAAGVSGCQSAASRRVAELESRVRVQAEELRSLEAARSEALVIEAAGETAAREAVDLKINSLLSGGLDRDGVPGDDTLAVLVTPVDRLGQPVRVAGRLEVEAVDFTRSRETQTVGSWQFEGDQMRDLWHTGVFGEGYRIQRAIPEPDADQQLTLHARLVKPDGTQFDATGQARFRAGQVRVLAGSSSEDTTSLPSASE